MAEPRSDRNVGGGQFSLLDEPWIYVRRINGTAELVSVRTAFREADDIAEIVGDLPTQVFALLRLLLAVLHRAVMGPTDHRHWERLWRRGIPVDLVDTYLDRYRARWNLFDSQTPFMQVADLRTAKAVVSGLEKLIADVPNGFPFFTTRLGPGLERISAAEGARWLVHTHAFDSAGIRSGAVGDPSVKGGKGYPIGPGWAGQIGGLYLDGRNLRETLLLNLIPWSGSTGLLEFDPEEDLPTWEQPPRAGNDRLDVTDSSPSGPISLYTWQSRRLRLVGGVTGITGVVLTLGDKMTPQNRQGSEPMTGWRFSDPQTKKRGHTTYMPRKHVPERAFWRSLPALMPGVGQPGSGSAPNPSLAPAVLTWAADVADVVGADQRFRTRAVGVTYGPQESTIVEVIDDSVDLAVGLLAKSSAPLAGAIESAVAAADNAARAIGTLAANLARASGASGDGAGDGERQVWQERAFVTMDSPFRSWLAGLEPGVDPYDARTTWELTVRDRMKPLAAELIANIGPMAWQGRMAGDRLVNLPIAERWYRIALIKALPLVYRPASLSLNSVDPDLTPELAL